MSSYQERFSELCDRLDLEKWKERIKPDRYVYGVSQANVIDQVNRIGTLKIIEIHTCHGGYYEAACRMVVPT